MGSPVITLYATKAAREESLTAFHRLESLQLGFSVEPSTSSDVAVEFGGRVYPGLSAVDRMIGVLRQFEQTVLAANTELDAEIERRQRPEIRERARAMVDRQVEEARVRLRAVLD